MAGNNACTITGGARVALCHANRMWLSKYIYQGDKNYYKTSYGAKADAIFNKYWEETFSPLDNDKLKLKGRLYETKDKSYGACDPVVVFRGTEFDDKRGMMILVTIELFGLKNLYYTYGTTADNGLSYITKPSTKGLELVFSRCQSASVRLGSIIPHQTLMTVSGKLTLEIYASEEGNWANNFRQAFGKPSMMYKAAITYGRQCIKYLQPKIDSARATGFRTPIVYFAGHSLGGGLAMAAATANAPKSWTCDLSIDTFNSASVHGHTVGQDYQTASSSCPLTDFTVRDEILTTLQNDNRKLPIIGTIFQILKVDLPQASCVPSRTPAMDPEKKACLPALLPLSEKTHPKIFALDKALQRAMTVEQFFTYLNTYLIETYAVQDPEFAKVWEKFKKPYLGTDASGMVIGLAVEETKRTWSMYMDALDKLVADLEAEGMPNVNAMVDRHAMDYVIAAYEAATGTRLK